MSTVEPTLTQRTAAGMAWTSTAQVLRQILQIISVSVLARHVPPAAYGMMAMAAVVTGMLETVRDLGLGQALIREREVSDELASTLFWLNVLQGGAIAVIVALSAQPASFFFHEPLLVPVLRALSGSFFLGAVAVVPTALLTRAMQFRKLALIQAIAAITGTGFAIGIAIAGGQVWALVAGSLVIAITTAVGAWIAAPVRIKFVIQRGDIRRFLSFGVNLSGFHILNYFSRNADNLLVGRFLGPSALGCYQMGYTLMSYPLQHFALLVSQVVYPAISSFRDDQDRFRAAYVRSSCLIALVTVPLMFGLMVTAGPFVRVFLGDRWMPVASLLMVYAPLGALQSIAAPVGLIFESQGRPDLRFRWMVFASICYVVSFVVGLRWGFMGVGVSYAIVWTLLMMPSLHVPFRLIGLRSTFFLRALWPGVWMASVMALCAELWRIVLQLVAVTNPLIELLSTVGLSLTVYATLMLMVKPPVILDLAMVLEQCNIACVRGAARRLRDCDDLKAQMCAASAVRASVCW